MRTVTSKVTYRVPSWEYCNHQSTWNPSHHTEAVCRFCVSGKKGAKACSLYNEPLDVVDGTLVRKLPSCVRASAGFASEVSDVPSIDPKDVVKVVMREYRKAYVKLIADGYPDIIAHELASKTLGGLM